ncbi:hypothetical protein DXG01_015391 [Tephrocybe rancida]|nr:hypothetical protein DXG01_015391 [Tephrocybe rancida]
MPRTLRARFRSSSTPTVKSEEVENTAALVVPSADGLNIRVRKLLGTRIVYFRPEGHWVDEENNLVYFYWRDVDDGPFRLAALSLQTGKWTEKRRLLKLKNAWSPLSREFDANEAALPQHRGAADTFCVINDHRLILLFGGQNSDGGDPTSDLFAICLDMSKWWKVDIPDEVSPRMDAKMTFVDNHLYIFGGRNHESYSIAHYDTGSDKWSWVARDEPYPSHIPHLGFAGAAIAVYGGAQILLIPGCTDVTLDQPYSHYPASHVVLFDTASRIFRLYDNVEGEFPVDIVGINSFVMSDGRLLDGNLAVKAEPEGGFSEGFLNTCSSIIIATWHNDEENSSEDDPGVHDVPELWTLNLSTTQKSACRRLDVRQKLESLGITFACCVGIASQQILLFGSSTLVDNEGVFDRCVVIDV